MVTFQLFNEKSKYNLFEFEFLQTLGSGSFANVKLVKEKKTGKLFALKMVRITNSKTTNAEIYNIKCEIFIHRKLDHPNIIKFHDYIQYDSGVYLVLDYTENGNLYTYLHRKKILPEKDVFRFFHQTCLAVQYLHQNDVLHRDIKPENLLLDKDLNIKLCDFGWATQRIQDKRLTFCGTYEYMAPEIAYKRPYDYKVDIWSLGILLYELIHGEPPYKGRSLPEIYKSFTRGLVKFNANIHPEAKDLIQKILKQNPNDRLSLAQILTHPWVRYNLSKEENVTPTLPNIPQQKVLFHSHSLPPEVTDTTPTADPIERHSKENYYEPRTATHAQAKISQYDNWSEYFKGNQTDIVETSRPILDCSEAGKVFDKNNKTAPEVKDDSMMKILYSSNSNKDLNNIPFKPVVENAYMLPEPTKRRSPSPKSAVNTGLNAQTPNLVRTPEKSCENKNKIFVNNIFSPSFKSKLTNVIRQLSIQTPSNQASNPGSKTINSAASSKNVLQQINQNTPLNQSNQASSPLAKAFSMQLEKENQKKYSDPKEDYTQQVTSPHLEFFTQDVYQYKSEHHISNTMDDMKINFTEHVYHHSSSKEFPLAPSSSAATTRTNTLDLSHGNEIRSPFERSSKEAVEQYRYFPPESIKENLKTSPALRANSNNKQTDLEEYLQSQASKKVATKPKGIHEPNIVRYHIPINSIMTPNNGQTNKDKHNFLGYHEK